MMTAQESFNARRLDVVMFQRRALPGQHSVERVFHDVRAAMSEDIGLTTHILPFASSGIVNRLRNMLFARRHRGEINHIVGDVTYLALVLPRGSTVLTILDLISIRRLRGPRRWLLVLLWYRLPVWRSEAVTVISQSIRQELISLLPWAAKKTTVVYCPLSPGFRPVPSPEKRPAIALQVGTGPNKNLERVATALRALPVHLRIIGRLSEAQRRHLDQVGIEYSEVSMIEDQQIRTEYARSQLVVFASTYEGFGLPIIEGQATGRPVITSSVASMPEVAGAGALLVDPFDVVQIQSAARSLLEDRHLTQSLVQRGFENVKRFSPRGIAQEYASLYRALGPTD